MKEFDNQRDEDRFKFDVRGLLVLGDPVIVYHVHAS